MTIEEQVRGFVTENYYLGEHTELTDDLSLIDSGIVDSTGMLEIILFIEETFGIEVEDQETVPENLETLGRIGAFVARKLAQDEAAQELAG